MGRGWDVNIYLIHLLKALCLCWEDMEKSTAAAEVEQESHQEIDVEEAVESSVLESKEKYKERRR